MKSFTPSKLVRSKINHAVLAALVGLSVNTAYAADEAQEIEEVVAVGQRLKGSAGAVLQERQNQAFVADIMGAEQISRTGDGDAASALRRVTGLTLVDGKFIYVRGLGERYSSTQLNSMYVPSPDPTRSVVPLDLFPSDIIESLSVQKSFSPDMPAHFGGGNVNIRTKSIPTDFLFKVDIGTSYNTNNSDKGYFYEGGDDDWMGRDDGTRALPSEFIDAFYGAGLEGDINTTLAERQALMSALDWNISATEKDVDPEMSFSVSLGDRFESEMGTFGVLAAVSYENEWEVAQEKSGTNLGSLGCEDKCFAQYYDGTSTEQNVRWSGTFNIGYEFNSNHKIELTNIALHDMRDRVRNRNFYDANETEEGVRDLRRVDVVYEEREMFSSQLKGTHNFIDFNNLFVDWYAGTSRANRDAPGGVDAVFQRNYDDGAFVSEQLQDVSATNVTREFQVLHDEVDTWGWNMGMPFYGEGYELELKVGGDFSEKTRNANNTTFGITHRGISDDYSFGSRLDEIFAYDNINNDAFYASSTGSGIFDDRTTDGDKYSAAHKLDAYYFMADYFIDNTWRITGGVRWEDFAQVSVPFKAHSNLFDATTDELAEVAIKEDDFYPSLAVTYIMDEEMQFRLNLSETTIRPDMRDVSSTFFVDPLTEFLVRGSPTLQSSKLKNADFRFEWYMASGNNLSVALFYKDITNPIEMVELAGVGGAAPQLLTANAESGELTGIEVDFLTDFSFISADWSSVFLSGNVTLSDSSVKLGIDDSDGVDSLFEQQLKDALDADTVSNIVTNDERRLVGHSEWVANLQMGYDSADGFHSTSLVYNVFGPRIIVPGTRGNEDAEEKPFHSLDLVYSYFPNFNTKVKFKIENILGQDKEIEQEGLSLWKKEEGTKFSLGFSYEF
ncbi:MAG: TonB-dependent receptor [Pseudoalteromonas sp.]|mgnify:FL=1|uniref:TonB-dependent receptor domain-containing protein n=1 Tax=Pseudoalteromonas sp. TaxID=53249 RepID=UPI000C91D379|nr:TonB-dependent receptor [Pseudoalteromonas sp.]MAD03736.1 TonB-dependent receptor [Pseudoalteromonas sp.]|tara:strand:+ start:54744 stop:57434 length:2691 start_codon:yes stop_codon:yes gene_type:complete